MNFFKKVIDFVVRPTHSRTMGILIFFLLITAVSLTVIVAQQQQTLRQRAAEPVLTLNVEPSACPDSSITFSWNKISGADKYLLYRGHLEHLVCETSDAQCKDSNVERKDNTYSYILYAGTRGSIYALQSTGWIPVNFPLCGAPTNTSTPTAVPTNTLAPTPTPIPNTNPVVACRCSLPSCNPTTGICQCGGGCFGGQHCEYSQGSPSSAACVADSTQPSGGSSAQQPAATAAPAPTPVPVNNVTLVLALNARDALLAPDKLPVNFVLYSLTTNSPVGPPATQSFAKTPIPGKQYSANVSLSNLHQDRYFIIARKDNMIAKSVFTVSSSNETITVPTTTLVFGDLNNDSDINILDHDNVFKACWKKAATGSCVSSDFDKNGAIDQIDYNTFLRGFAAWQKQGQDL